MMTVVIRGRRPRRRPLIDYPSPRTWCIGAERYYFRTWAPETEAGGAKPGRGGRRKRKADRAIIRKRIGRGVERKGWPLLWELRILRLSHMPTRFTRKLAMAPLLVPPSPLGVWPARTSPGRRERRRRAKLRRRRARRERALVRTLKAVRMWGSNAISRLVTSGADPTVKLYGVTRTPGV